VFQMHIRKAEITDAKAITALVNRAYRPAAGTEGWTHESALVEGDRINQSKVATAILGGTVLVGTCEQGLMGCIHIEVADQVAHIGMLAVDPLLQNSGAGKRLLKQAEEIAVREFNAAFAVLVVIAARKELVDYYLRRGYKQTEERSQYPIHAGVGRPTKDAMLLTTLRKPLNDLFSDDQIFDAARIQSNL